MVAKNQSIKPGVRRRSASTNFTGQVPTSARYILGTEAVYDSQTLDLAFTGVSRQNIGLTIGLGTL